MAVDVVDDSAEHGVVVFLRPEVNGQIAAGVGAIVVGAGVPVPVVLLSRPAPPESILVLAVGHRGTDGHGYRAQSPHDIAVVGLRFLDSREVEVATPGVEPRPGEQLNPSSAVAALEGVAEPCLTDIVDGGPDEVADDIVVTVHVVPDGGHGIGVGFCAADDALRELCVVALVAMRLVVVATDLHEVESPG